MKTILSVIAALLITVNISSCKSDWPCVCTYDGPVAQSILEYYVSGTSQRDASISCQKHADSLTVWYSKGGTPPQQWKCSL